MVKVLTVDKTDNKYFERSHDVTLAPNITKSRQIKGNEVLKDDEEIQTNQESLKMVDLLET